MCRIDTDSHIQRTWPAVVKGLGSPVGKLHNSSSSFGAATTTASLLANVGTNWIFKTPNSPHYGPLWEAGVKSTKHQVKGLIGQHSLTFEEPFTLLVEIEACLNSRPLCPMSPDIEDLHTLTPAHFLISKTSMLTPDKEPPLVLEICLSRYQLLQRVRDNLWKRSFDEFLWHLQEREKWSNASMNFVVVQLVLIRRPLPFLEVASRSSPESASRCRRTSASVLYKDGQHYPL